MASLGPSAEYSKHEKQNTGRQGYYHVNIKYIYILFMYTQYMHVYIYLQKYTYKCVCLRWCI